MNSLVKKICFAKLAKQILDYATLQSYLHISIEVGAAVVAKFPSWLAV